VIIVPRCHRLYEKRGAETTGWSGKCACLGNRVLHCGRRCPIVFATRVAPQEECMTKTQTKTNAHRSWDHCWSGRFHVVPSASACRRGQRRHYDRPVEQIETTHGRASWSVTARFCWSTPVPRIEDWSKVMSTDALTCALMASVIASNSRNSSAPCAGSTPRSTSSATCAVRGRVTAVTCTRQRAAHNSREGKRSGRGAKSRHDDDYRGQLIANGRCHEQRPVMHQEGVGGHALGLAPRRLLLPQRTHPTPA
jgi:hypothetical protein